MKGCRILSFLILSSLFLVSACTSPNPEEVKRTACNKLKSDIVFNAATSNVRQADIERTERPLQEQTYDKNNCECY